MMIKRIKLIIVTVLLIMFLFPASAFADDGPSYLDTKEHLSFSVKANKRVAKIGEDIQITLTLRNNTSYPITIYKIYEIFENTFIYDEYYDDNNPKSLENLLNHLVINAGERADIKINTTVPDNIDWYVKNGDFYADIKISTEYDVKFNESHESWLFSPIHKPIPIKISNIYDGSEFLQIDVEEEETIFYVPVFDEETSSDYWDVYSFSEIYDYSTEITNKITLSNKSDEELSDILIRDLYYKEKVISNISPESDKSEYFYIHKRFLYDNIPSRLEANYKVQFMRDGKFYGVYNVKEYPVKILYPPEVEVSVLNYNKDTISSGYDYTNVLKVAAITNLSEDAISNLYFDADNNPYNYSDFYNDPDKIIHKLAPSQTVYLPLKQEINYRKWDYYIGYIVENNNLYYWGLNTNYNRDDHSDISDVKYDYYIFQFLQIPMKLLPLSKKNDTPTPTFTPSLTPTPASTPTTSHSPSPTTAPTDAPSHSPTEEPTIEVVEVKKSSSIPFWVWYLLTVAVVACVVLIIVFRKKNKENKYD